MSEMLSSMNGSERLPPVEERRRNFGSALAQRRQDQGLSQTRLGQMLGVGQSAVSSWELGEAEPPVEVVYRMEDIFKVKSGTLSRHLGWMPIRSRPGRPSRRILDVLEEDPDFRDDELGKRLLRSMIKELLRNKPRGRQRAT